MEAAARQARRASAARNARVTVAASVGLPNVATVAARQRSVLPNRHRARILS